MSISFVLKKNLSTPLFIIMVSPYLILSYREIGFNFVIPSIFIFIFILFIDILLNKHFYGKNVNIIYKRIYIVSFVSFLYFLYGLILFTDTIGMLHNLRFRYFSVILIVLFFILFSFLFKNNFSNTRIRFCTSPLNYWTKF